jgi:hypothetical protein
MPTTHASPLPCHQGVRSIVSSIVSSIISSIVSSIVSSITISITISIINDSYSRIVMVWSWILPLGRLESTIVSVVVGPFRPDWPPNPRHFVANHSADAADDFGHCCS